MTAPAVFTPFASDDIVVANPTQVSVGIFTGDTGSLTNFYTSAVQTASLPTAQYYWDIYNQNVTGSLADIQFSIAYGHVNGGGDPSLTQINTAVLATEGTYLQYRNMLLTPGTSLFNFLGNYNSPHIFVINLRRSRLKELIDPGNWMLTLSGSSGSITLIDDSGQTLGPLYGKTGVIFNVVSGSLTGPSGSTIAPAPTSSLSGGYGLFFPETGLIVLNPDALANAGMYSAGNPVVTNPTNPSSFNQQHLFNSMVRGGLFQMRSAETISSTHYFVRLKNSFYNYSNNPSFFNATNGQLVNSDFIQNPVTYVTSIGLYNDLGELLAIGKLSKPTKKSFDQELLVRVRLDF